MPDGPATARVLLIDDEDVTRLVVTELLQALGYTVVGAETGRAGLEALSEARFDAVITDYSLADMNGGEVAAAIKQTTPGLPVILLTGWDPARAQVAAGAFDYILRKPCNLDELADTMEQALDRKSEAA